MNKRHTHIFRPLSMAILIGIVGFLVACRSPPLSGEYAPETTRLAPLQPTSLLITPTAVVPAPIEFTLPDCPADTWTVLPSYPITLPINLNEASTINWSPTGKQLAFPLDDTVWVASPPDYIPQQLMRLQGVRLGGVRWSPDGSQLALSGSHRSSAINSVHVSTFWITDSKGSAAVDLLDGNDLLRDYQSTPKWISHWLDNQRLAFAMSRGTGYRDLWQVDTVTREIAPLVAPVSEISIGDPRAAKLAGGGVFYISPTNPHLMVVDAATMWHLAVVDLTTYDDTWVSNPRSSIYQRFLGWAADGGSFLYAQGIHDSEQPLELWRWQIAEQQAIHLMAGVPIAKLSPDGYSLAFVQQTDGQVSLGVRNLASGETTYYRRVAPETYNTRTSMREPDRRFFWSPTGKFLLYVWSENTDAWFESTLWMVSLDAQCQQRLMGPVSSSINVQWSADDHLLALVVEPGPDRHHLFLLRHSEGDN